MHMAVAGGTQAWVDVFGCCAGTLSVMCGKTWVLKAALSGFGIERVGQQRRSESRHHHQQQQQAAEAAVQQGAAGAAEEARPVAGAASRDEIATSVMTWNTCSVRSMAVMV